MKRIKGKKLYFLVVVLWICVCLSVNSIKVTVEAESYAEGKAECVIEVESGRILYESRGDIRLPMASTTKIVTAMTVLRLCKDLQEEIVIPQKAVGIEGSSVYLKEGEIYTVEDLLYGLMLRSGNDCAVALAIRFGTTVPKFSKLMNETAQMAGALHSRFANPHGLHEKNHYTTARDLAYITSYAMHNTNFQKIVSTKFYEKRGWKNKNKMLSMYEGGIGVKTGYTKEAGRCLVSAMERDGMTLACVVLNCPMMYERSFQLLDDAFKSYRKETLLSPEDVLSMESEGKIIQGRTRETYQYPLLDGEKERVEIKTKACQMQNMKEIVGEFQIYLSKRLLFSGFLYKL